MTKPVYMISGSKGGVGKSIVSMAVTHYLLKREEALLLVDADTANPDVGKAYGKAVETAYFNLDEKEGWMDLANVLGEHFDRTVVINTPARSGEGVKLYGTLLTESMQDLDRELVTLWVINSQRDSLQLLKEYVDAIQSGTTHVMRNLYHGPERKFELYNSSKIRSVIEAQGKTVNFPEVADRISDQLHSERMTIQKVIETAPVGNRAEVNRWVKECASVFAEVVQ
jgi:NUBPL iron-transfer P-loop NTPase